ncbi:MAG: PleD family two-component system response regulator [Phycisphaerales bacterium JB054]
MDIKVLIADDDVVLLTSLSIRLKSEGYEVFCVQDSYQAVDQSGKIKPDVLVLDINMPAGDGFTVQERLHKMSALQNIPVIYLTGERSDRVATMAKTQGAFALLFKPCETQDLLDAIAAAAELAASRRAA